MAVMAASLSDSYPMQENLDVDAPGQTVFERFVALSCFAGLLFLTVALIGLKVSDFPVRSLVAIGLLGIFTLIYPSRIVRAVQNHVLTLWLALAFAILGVFVSAVYGSPLSTIFRGLMEVPLQIAITLVLASALARLSGTRSSVMAIVAVVGASTLVALFQFLDVGAAWDLARWLGQVQGRSAFELSESLESRPMGLSYSKIHLSTQLCLAFAAYTAFKDGQSQLAHAERAVDPMIIVALLLLFVGCLATGTRAPILGGIIFFVLYALHRPGSWLLILALIFAAFLIVIGPTLLAMVQEVQPRFFRSDDNSASGRTSLVTFGFLLFFDNPLGYGYGFEPTEHWTKFWQDLYHQDHPTSITVADLHNYPLNMLNTYGVGLLLLVPLVYALLRRGRHAIIFFIPYIVQILFHNSGPFWNDIVFWFVVAALAAQNRQLIGRANRPFDEQDISTADIRRAA